MPGEPETPSLRPPGAAIIVADPPCRIKRGAHRHVSGFWGWSPRSRPLALLAVSGRLPEYDRKPPPKRRLGHLTCIAGPSPTPRWGPPLLWRCCWLGVKYEDGTLGHHVHLGGEAVRGSPIG